MANSISEVDSTPTHPTSTPSEQDDASSVSTRQRQKGKLGLFLQRQTKSQQERRGSQSSQASSATNSSLNSSLASGSLFAHSIGANSQASSKNSTKKKNLFRRAWDKRRSSKQKLRSSYNPSSNASVSSSVASDLDHDLEAFLEKTLPADNIQHINSVVEEYQLLAAQAAGSNTKDDEPEEDKSTTTQQREQQLNHLRSELAQAESEFLALQRQKQVKGQDEHELAPQLSAVSEESDPSSTSFPQEAVIVSEEEVIASNDTENGDLDTDPTDESPKIEKEIIDGEDDHDKSIDKTLQEETSTTHLDAVEEGEEDEQDSSSSPSESELLSSEDFPCQEVTGTIMTPSAPEEMDTSTEMKGSFMKEVVVLSPLTPLTVEESILEEEGATPDSLVEIVDEHEPVTEVNPLDELSVPNLAATTSAVVASSIDTAPTSKEPESNTNGEVLASSDLVHNHDEQVDRIWSDGLDPATQEQVQCQYEAFLDQKLNLFDKHFHHDDEADVLLEQQMQHFEMLQNQPIVLEPVLVLEGEGNLEEESDYFLEQKMEVFEKLYLHDDVSDEMLHEKLQLFDSFYGPQSYIQEEYDSENMAGGLDLVETGPSEAEILLQDMVEVFVV